MPFQAREQPKDYAAGLRIVLARARIPKAFVDRSRTSLAAVGELCIVLAVGCTRIPKSFVNPHLTRRVREPVHLACALVVAFAPRPLPRRLPLMMRLAILRSSVSVQGEER